MAVAGRCVVIVGPVGADMEANGHQESERKTADLQRLGPFAETIFESFEWRTKNF